VQASAAVSNKILGRNFIPTPIYLNGLSAVVRRSESNSNWKIGVHRKTVCHRRNIEPPRATMLPQT